MDFNYRLPIPERETLEEKRARVRREKQQASAFMKFRMDVIAETYSVHLKDLFLTVAYKEFLKRCGKELEKMKDLQTTGPQFSGDHYFEVDSHGSVADVSVNPARKTPSNFYRTTKLASWRIFRHHHEKYGHQPKPAGFRRVSFIRPLRKEKNICPYQEYLHMISDMMVRTKAQETKLEGKSKQGSFMMLTPFERHKLKSDIKSKLIKPLPDTPHRIRRMDVPAVKRVADKLTEQKLEEVEMMGKKVLFKGRGVPGQSGRHSRSSRSHSRGRNSRSHSRSRSHSPKRRTSHKSNRSRSPSPSPKNRESTTSQESKPTSQSSCATTDVATESDATTRESDNEKKASSPSPSEEAEEKPAS